MLYVAMTRAIHATHIIASHGAKVDHKSAAGILLSTLCPDAKREEGILFEHGDREWYQSTIPETTEEDRYGLSEFYLPAEPKLTKGTVSRETRTGRGIPQTSPSQLEGGDKLVLKSIFRSESNRAAMARGRLLHACFELVNWLDESEPTRQQLTAHLRTIDPTLADFTDVIDSFYKMIKQGNVRNLLSRESYQETYLLDFPDSKQLMVEANRLEVENERPFAIQLEGCILQGVIDRLVLVYENDRLVAADVIDFKTDSFAESELPERIEFYKPQLSSYRQAACKFTNLPLEKVSARLLFVDSDKLVNVELVENSASADVAKKLKKPTRKKPKTTATGKVNQTVPKPKNVARHERQQTLWPED